jgi:hypothetical protein
MRILDGTATLDTVSELLRASSWARIAVAYWGKGAVKRLGLADAKARRADVQIALDLRSGACNPKEVQDLLDLFGKTRVLAVDGLHAKLWLAEAGGVIGSSNASANGFGHEGDEKEVTGLIEANLLIQPLGSTIERDWCRWFDASVWARGKRITDNMMREAERRWRKRRGSRGTDPPIQEPGGSLLDRMRVDPGFFRDKPLSVWVHPHDGLSSTATRGLKTESKARQMQALDCYEGCRLVPREYILDFEWDASTNYLRFDGLWQVLEDRPNVRLDGTSISLVRPVSAFEGLSIVGERPDWRSAVRQILPNLGRKTRLHEAAEDFASRLARG